MARLDKSDNRKKPWKAEVKINYTPYYLGHFATRQEAEAAERAFRFEMTGSPYPSRGVGSRRKSGKNAR